MRRRHDRTGFGVLQVLQSDLASDGVVRLVIGKSARGAFSAPAARAIHDGVKDARADGRARAILLASDGPDFAPDLALAAYEDEETLAAVTAAVQAIEHSEIPVVAAIDGVADGAGLEIALAAHMRVVGPRGAFSHRGIEFGLLPYSGGIQRLSRLVGPAACLDILLSGRRIGAAEAGKMGLADIVETDQTGLARAQEMAAAIGVGGPRPKPSRQRSAGLNPASTFIDVVQKARENARGSRIVTRLIDCIEAAQLLPFEAGVAYEETAARECRVAPGARARRYLAAALPQGVQHQTGPDEGLIALAASDDFALEFGVSALRRGLSLAVVAPPDSREAVAGRLAEIWHSQTPGGPNGTGAAFESAMARCEPAAGREALALADFVIANDAPETDSLIEDLHPGAVLGVLLPPGKDIAHGRFAAKSAVVGLRMASADGKRRLIEIAVPHGFDPDAEIRLRRFASRLGRVAVFTPMGDGGLGSAVWGAGVFAMRALARTGVDPSKIDDALRDRGFGMLPFHGNRIPLGAPLRDMAPEEVTCRWLDAMANAGALLVQAGIARAPADVDLVLVHGYGFPQDLGGAMFAADKTGLLNVRNRLRSRMGEQPEFWAPAPLFDTLIKEGGRFGNMPQQA